MSRIDVDRMIGDVMAWRHRVEGQFPTPSVEDSLAFAVTEAAEALDAQLRENHSYKRNAEKEHSVERELVQCALMLLTALASAGLCGEKGMLVGTTLHDVLVDVTTAYQRRRGNRPGWAAYAVDGLRGIVYLLYAEHCVMPPVSDLLRNEMARLEAKHCGTPSVHPGDGLARPSAPILRLEVVSYPLDKEE